jgi:hypothetical protein
MMLSLEAECRVEVFVGKDGQMIQLSHHYLSSPSRIGKFHWSNDCGILSFRID